jgi:hypothetical protein
MSDITRAVIDERIRTFAESVRKGIHGFKPGESWWIVKPTSKSKDYYKNAISLTDQLGLSEKDMENAFSARWVGNIGSNCYTQYLRQGKVDRFYLVTVTIENSNNNSSPTDEGSTVVMKDEGFRTTRASKCPWMMLRDSVSGTAQFDTDLGPRPKKSRLDDSTTIPTVEEVSSHLSGKVPLPPVPSYWDSTEANILFGTIKTVQRGVIEANAYEAITNQMALLLKCSENHDGYLQILNTSGMEEVPKLSDNQIFFIREKIRLLNRCLQHAIHYMEEKKNWGYCCEEAISDASTFGITICSNANTLKRWYRDFRVNRKLPFPKVPDKHKLPLFLSQNQDIVTKIKVYAKANIHKLSAQLICSYLHETILPQMIENIKQSDPPVLNRENFEIYTQACLTKDYTRAKEHLLSCYGMKFLTESTAYRWMRKLGFKYEARKKSYYVDGHEKKATKLYRAEYLRRYFADERRAHRWIQITKEEHDELMRKSMCDFYLLLLFVHNITINIFIGYRRIIQPWLSI